MTIHPRHLIVDEASLEIEAAVLDASHKHNLTYVERLSILNQLMASALKYALREERDPDDSKR